MRYKFILYLLNVCLVCGQVYTTKNGTPLKVIAHESNYEACDALSFGENLFLWVTGIGSIVSISSVTIFIVAVWIGMLIGLIPC